MRETEMSSQLKAPAGNTWEVSVPLVRRCDGPSGWSGHGEGKEKKKERKKLSHPTRNLIAVVQAHSHLSY
jgi:hypothetical protein